MENLDEDESVAIKECIVILDAVNYYNEVQHQLEDHTSYCMLLL